MKKWHGPCSTVKYVIQVIVGPIISSQYVNGIYLLSKYIESLRAITNEHKFVGSTTFAHIIFNFLTLSSQYGLYHMVYTSAPASFSIYNLCMKSNMKKYIPSKKKHENISNTILNITCTTSTV